MIEMEQDTPFLHTMRLDLKRWKGRWEEKGQAGKSRVFRMLAMLTLPGPWSAGLLRLARSCHHRGLGPLASLFSCLNLLLFGADIHPGAKIGPGLFMPHPIGVKISNGVTIGEGATILHGASIGGWLPGTWGGGALTHLGDRVLVLSGAQILGPIEVGDDAMIAAGAVVLSSVPSGAIFAGNPARLVRYRFPAPGSSRAQGR